MNYRELIKKLPSWPKILFGLVLILTFWPSGYQYFFISAIIGRMMLWVVYILSLLVYALLNWAGFKLINNFSNRLVLRILFGPLSLIITLAISYWLAFETLFFLYLINFIAYLFILLQKFYFFRF